MAKAKKVKNVIKLQIQAGRANPAPPIGPILGQTGINIQQFCQQFNDKTKDQMGSIIPVVVTIYEDRSFTFITKISPASDLLKEKLELLVALLNQRKTRLLRLRKNNCTKLPKLRCQT